MALHSEGALLWRGQGEDDVRIESEALRGAVGDLQRWGDVDLVPGKSDLSSHLYTLLLLHGDNACGSEGPTKFMCADYMSHRHGNHLPRRPPTAEHGRDIGAVL